MFRNNKNLSCASSFSAKTSSFEITKSDYLRSVLDPKSGPAGIPDYNMTTAHPKAVTMNVDLVVAGSGRFMIVYLPHSDLYPAILFIWSNALNRFVYSGPLNYDQDLGESYTLGRFVSGLLEVKSNTLTGSLFTVSGNISAASFQEMPDLALLTFNKVTSYKRNNVDVVSQVSVVKGVTALAIPDGDENYIPFRTKNTYATDAFIEIFSRCVYQDQAQVPFVVGPTTYPAAGVYEIVNATVANGSLPPNSFGPNIYVEFTAQVATTGGAGNTNSIVLTMEVTSTSISGVDWITTTAILIDDTTTVRTDTTDIIINQITLKVPYDNVAPIERVRVYATVVGPTANLWNLRRMILTMKLPTYYSQGANGPGTIIAVEAVSPGQQISVSGVGNYEVVPNAQLSKDIPTSNFSPFNPLEMQLVGTYLSGSSRYGIRFLWEKEIYEAFLLTGKLEEHVDLPSIANASGFTDFLKGLGGIVKIGAPLIGGLLGGPGGMAIGSAISSAIPSSSSFRVNNSGIPQL